MPTTTTSCCAAMNLPTVLGVACAGAILFGCAAPPSQTTTASLSPEEVVGRLNGKKLSARGDVDSTFALAELRLFFRPPMERCRADGGDLVVLGHSDIQFTAKTNAAGPAQARLLLPTRLACRTSSAFVWGASVSYGGPQFFASQWAGEMYYYANMQLGFIAGDSLERSEPTSAANREINRKMSEECAALRAAYTQKVRTAPQIGMAVAYGVIIDLKPPIALVQYDAFSRQLKGRDQEWVQIASLGAGSDCPR